MRTVAAASAPASIGNVGVGFDVLGLAFDAVRDHVAAARSDAPGVRLGAVSGCVDALPETVEANTALRAAQALLDHAGADFGVTLSIAKAAPLAAGMGGSAASACAAAVAVNALLDAPLEHEALLPFALEGERASADPPPWDNVMASLLGGLVIAARCEPALVRRLPAPQGVRAVLFHPAARIETRAARAALSDTVSLTTAVEHARRSAAFAAGCALGDLALMRAGLEDVLVEPQRAHLLPAFASVKAAAMKAGAIGCSFSGSGPSVFAWAEAADADAVAEAMAAAFAAADLAATRYEAPLASPGARLEPAA